MQEAGEVRAPRYRARECGVMDSSKVELVEEEMLWMA